ncbi:MAG: hypothetical protein HRU14_07095 [Planctomycetes bacterium]|nr:hypothetical protein [Planctomycetota bacterium]
MQPSGNTALCWHDGRMWAILRPEARTVWSWRPGGKAWESICRMPRAVPGGMAYDIELLSDQGGLVLISGDRWARLTTESLEWRVGERLPFAAAADGGMAALDPETRRVHLVLGGGSRDMGVIDLRTGSARRLADHLPDAASVHGRRIWITETAGERHLYVYRGHDSDELWRIALE